MSNIDVKSVNAIRILAVDAIEKANSGHPGLPLGAAPMTYELWANHMNHNSQNPNWPNRDRFVLSAGHGSALLYSLLHLFGYGNLSIEDLKQFRQLDSLTPGHPEYGHTIGVEATTGPLGAGMGMAVGMAIAETHLASKFNKEAFPIVDHYTYVLGGDGCMMEGITSEALSLAGTLGLHKLIVFYDSNQISIEGDIEIAFTEDVTKRFEAFGFQTLIVEDGNDLKEIGIKIEEAKADKTRPSLITVKTKIGYGCPNKEGKASAHGEPLGQENVSALKANLEWESESSFFVPDDVYEHISFLKENQIKKNENWNQLFELYCEQYPEMKELWEQYHNDKIGLDAYHCEHFWKHDEEPQATRVFSGTMINRMKDHIPNLIGGSADLAPSTKTYMDGEGDFSKQCYEGRNLHFGVRELAMAAIGNGLMLHGGLKAYVSTFFVFSDYLKPMARLSALMGVPLTYVFTHDSIGVGEDGPTHQPIEQLAMFRSLPNFHVFRPADAVETAAAWYWAITSKKTPTALVLSRQNVPQLVGSSKEALKGGYILQDCIKEIPDAILIATGSEVELAVNAKTALQQENINIRVVSMPCMDLFEEQSKQYKDSVLLPSVRVRVAIEAASSFGWDRYVGLDGATITMEEFGSSAPASVLFEKYGFTVEHIVQTVKDMLSSK